MLAISGVLFLVEFLADKVPIVDSVWDAIHTVIRPVGGAFLASRALGDLSPVAEVLAFLLLGGATLTTHAAKATTRLAVNASPEPVSNVLVSLAENGLVAGAVWLALTHPLLALVAALLALAVAVTLVAWLGLSRSARWLATATEGVPASRAAGSAGTTRPAREPFWPSPRGLPGRAGRRSTKKLRERVLRLLA